MPEISFLNILAISLISGITGTLFMTIFMMAVNQSGMVNADMVRALGSFFTKSLNKSFQVGIIIHFISGIFFAFFYSIAITSFNISGFLSFAGAGTLIGFIHGAVVAFLLVSTVAENHPLKKFQQAGFSVAVVHWVAHLIYGFIVGSVIGLMI